MSGQLQPRGVVGSRWEVIPCECHTIFLTQAVRENITEEEGKGERGRDVEGGGIERGRRDREKEEG